MKLGEEAMIKATPDFAYGAGGFAAWGESLLVGERRRRRRRRFPFPISRAHWLVFFLRIYTGIMPDSPLNFVIEVLEIK